MHKQQWETQLAQAQRRSAQLHRKNSQIAGVRFGLFLIAAWAFFPSLSTVGGAMGRS